jgi:hypothetical protein
MVILYIVPSKYAIFFTAQNDKLMLYFLPLYSLEFNPDELFLNVIKVQVAGRTVVEVKQMLRRLVRTALIRLQRSTGTLKRLYHEPNVS